MLIDITIYINFIKTINSIIFIILITSDNAQPVSISIVNFYYLKTVRVSF